MSNSKNFGGGPGGPIFLRGGVLPLSFPCGHVWKRWHGGNQFGGQKLITWLANANTVGKNCKVGFQSNYNYAA
jgi:hypothetical protein